MLFRNERKLYRRTCDFSGKEIISIYSPDKPYKVYDQKIRWSDVRDPLQYGKAFDFTKTFTEQFGELMEVVPRANFYGKGNENSDYNNHCSYSKNCYMSADLISAEDCFYVTTGIRTKDVVDSNLMTDCENCYSCIDCDHLYDCKFCIQSEDCKFSVSLSNCKNCSDCINCSNLIGKRYCIQNIQYTKQEYELLKKDNLNEFNLKGVLKATRLVNSEQCYGNQIFNSKNVSFSHLLYDSTDIKYSFLS